MNNEIEAQFLDIKKDEMRKKLAEIGAKLVKPEVLMRRFVFDTGPHSFARVRDEGGGKIVMTYKNISNDKSIMGTKEVNVVIDDYENGVLFMRGCGLEEKAEQESLRETWVYETDDGEVEICIDTWPWIPTFIEVEGPTEKSVWGTAKSLGFSKEQAKFGSVDTTYQHYYGVDTDIVNLHTPKILFNMEPPEWAKNKI
jgi:adenylate cyclase class 2